MPSRASAGCSSRFVRRLAVALLAAAAAPAAAQTGGGSIRGVVHDSLLAGGPLAGAVVELFELGRRSATDARGGFRFDGVPAGRHTLSFSHPSLAALGFPPPERVVELGAGVDVSVVLATPSPGGILARLCPGRREPGTGVLLGRMLDPATGAAAPGGEVAADWQETTLGPAGLARRPRAVGAAADSLGRYRLCGVPLDVPVLLSTRTAAGQGAPLAHDMADRPVAVRDLAPAPTDSTAPRTGLVTGTVRADDGRPLPGALVTLLGAGGGARTDSAGRFRLPAVPPGSYTVDARAIGYARGLVAAEPRPGTPDSVTVTLARLPTELPEVRVTAEAEADRTGFETRRARGVGYYIGRDDIRRRGTVRTEDLFKAVPGIRVQPIGGTDYQLLATRGGTGLSTTCAPVVFIDGFRVPLDPETGSGLPVLPEEIHGIEIYQSASETPVRYRPVGTSCAVVLVWTRRGGR
jgi:hypothetical protein